MIDTTDRATYFAVKSQRADIDAAQHARHAGKQEQGREIGARLLRSSVSTLGGVGFLQNDGASLQQGLQVGDDFRPAA